MVKFPSPNSSMSKVPLDSTENTEFSLAKSGYTTEVSLINSADSTNSTNTKDVSLSADSTISTPPSPNNLMGLSDNTPNNTIPTEKNGQVFVHVGAEAIATSDYNAVAEGDDFSCGRFMKGNPFVFLFGGLMLYLLVLGLVGGLAGTLISAPTANNSGT